MRAAHGIVIFGNDPDRAPQNAVEPDPIRAAAANAAIRQAAHLI